MRGKGEPEKRGDILGLILKRLEGWERKRWKVRSREVGKHHEARRVLNKLVLPEIGEEFLPGYGQKVAGTGAYRILAYQDEILKNTFFV